MTLRCALITGASAGLGAEFARQLAPSCDRIVLVARRQARLAALADELRAARPVEVLTVADDLGDPDAPSRIESAVIERGWTVDYLINNAGASGPRLMQEPWDEQRRYLDLMMLSVAELCHRFAPAMRAQGFGRIVNVASVAGRIARGGDCNYGPSKAYLIALSEELGLTLKPYGVHVTALCPGFTHTEFHDTPDLQVMKQSLPKFLWYDAATVVRDGLRAVERGRLICISGRLYRWVDPLLQSVFTRWLFRTGERAFDEA